MSVHRFDLRKCTTPARAAASSQPEEWNTLPERRQLAFRNVILLHTRDWSVRAIAEDLGIPTTTVQRWIDAWRAGKPVRQ